jgi:hypothetical protein
VQVLEVEPMSVAADDIAMRRAGWLDFDDLCAPVRQLSYGGWASAMGREVENGEVGKG